MTLWPSFSTPAILLAFVASSAAAAEGLPSPVDYERDVRPLLATKCSSCHGVLKQQSGLRLDAAQLILKGGESGPAVKPGKSGESLLIERVTAADGSARMPPDGEGEHLTAAQVALLKSWIDQGAKAPADEKIPEDPAQHWSYRPMGRPALPSVRNAAWVRNPIDAFIAAALEQRGLSPRVAAPREVWLRRVFLDLIGLPPTRDELHAFLADGSPTACEKVVDGLLERPEYGEHWGRHWMDVWRYSDWYGSRGINEIRYSQRHIWRWRDWIVESLNADKPYDRMIVEMLAGDELEPTDPDVLRATGFLGRNWYKFDRNVWMFETIEQTGQAFLGMTLKCCRCHDHKFDPITQEEYYRFRAFFEPHDVRTDSLAAEAPTEKDATLGNVLKDGLARVYDKEPGAKTFVFQRGDSRYPDEKRPVTPGVPASLLRPMGEALVEAKPIALPPEAYYPALRPEMVAGAVARAEAAVNLAREDARKAKDAAVAAREKAEAFAALIAKREVSTGDNPPVIHDNFAMQRKNAWKVTGGDWTWEPGKLAQRTVTSFATVVSTVNHPRDFQARVRYRTLKEGDYRSVGFSFDQNGPGDSQDVYTSVNDQAPAVQAFHRAGGQQNYPPAGIVRTPLKVGDEITVDVTVRGQQLAIVLNGERKLDYVMPAPRRDGKFALWVHNGAAEFLEVDVRALVPTLDDLRREGAGAEWNIEIAENRVLLAEAERAAIPVRIASERARLSGESSDAIRKAMNDLAAVEKRARIIQAREGVLEARRRHAGILAALVPAAGEAAVAEIPSAPSPALTQAEEAIVAAQAKLAEAEQSSETWDGKERPLAGAVFPSTSTGRRLALAQWMTHPKNPRTARVAVNHLWLRHFGEAIVSSVANFGLNGDRPSHPELLDWLAAELAGLGDRESEEQAAGAWRMKPLHRLMVLSATYRQSSSPEADAAWLLAPGVSSSTAARPSDNRFFWRMNSHRLEAEAVRDGVLATSGTLDPKRGGPEIPESEGQSVLRRSLYFRNTPNEKMKFLDLFDVANPNECYRRKESVVPQQALALMNSSLSLDSGRILAENLSRPLGERDDDEAKTAFIAAAFETVLTRQPTDKELTACRRFLEQNAATAQTANQPAFPAGGQAFRRSPSPKPHQRARENLVQVLYSHNDFVTVR